jgi:hypothetical protein
VACLSTLSSSRPMLHRATEVSRRVSAERARWEGDAARHRRSAARR